LFILHFRSLNLGLELLHVDDSTDAVALLHCVESVVDLAESLAVGDEFVNLEVTLLVVGNEVVQLRTALDTTESASSPHSASNKLEWSCGNLLASGGNTDDDGLTPTLVAGLEGSAHDTNIASAVKGVVATTVGHLDKLVLDGLVSEFGGVHEVSSTELFTPLLLGRVDVNNDNLASLASSGTLDNRKTDTASTEDGNIVAGLDVGGDGSSTVTGGDTAAEKAGSVHRSIVLDGNDGDIGDDGVLGEGGSAHEVKQILALALESRGAIGHQTLTLGGSDLTAKVGLSGLAELALLTFGGVESDDVVTGLDVGDALANGLDDTGTLVSKDNGESTLGILAGECVGICVANTSVVDLNSDLVGLGRSNLDVLNGERLAGLPGDGGLTGNGLANSRHYVGFM
jgi:hypothetical protein